MTPKPSYEELEARLKKLQAEAAELRVAASRGDASPQARIPEKTRENSWGTGAIHPFLDNSLVGIYRTDLDGTVGYVNAALVRMLGYDSADEMIAANALAFYRNPRDRSRLTDELHRTGAVERFEVDLLKKSGDSLTVLSSATLKEGQIFGVIVDITDRKRADALLVTTTNQFKRLFTHASVGIALHELVVDADGRAVDYLLTDVNPAYTNILGLAPEAVIGRPASHLYGTDPAPYLDIYAIVAQGGAPTTFDTYFSPMDKHFRIVVYSPKNGSFVTIFDDITDMKRAEIKLRESEERFRVLFEQANSAIFLHDLTGRFHAVNSKACDSLGYREHELLNLTVSDVDPDFVTREDAERFWQSLPVSFEGRHRRKDKTLLPVKVRLSKIVYRDQDLVLALVDDISQRKEAEQALADSERRLADIIDFLPDPTWVIDLDGRIIAWNQAVERMTGVLKKEIIGRSGYAHAVPFYGEARPTLANLVLQRDQRWEGQYLSFREERGNLIAAESFNPQMGNGGRYLSATAAKLYDAKGNVVGAIQTVRDITAAKRSEQDREGLIDELKVALAKVKTLSGMLPICSSCKKIRDDKGYWNQIESYIEKHTQADFSHGLCPDCMESFYGDQEWYKRGKEKGRF